VWGPENGRTIPEWPSADPCQDREEPGKFARNFRAYTGMKLKLAPVSCVLHESGGRQFVKIRPAKSLRASLRAA